MRSPSNVASRFRYRALARKLVRYSLTSVIGTTVGAGSLYFFTSALDWPGVPANLLAVSLGAIPSYLLNRHWTWQKRGPHGWFSEVLPFWAMTLAGLVLSTLFVAVADHRWGTPFAITVASTAGFGVLWLVKFVTLDRVLFRHRSG